MVLFELAWTDPEIQEEETERDADPRAARRESPTALLELPTHSPFFGANRRFLPRIRRSFTASIMGTAEESRIRIEGIDLSPSGMLCRSEEIVWPGNVLDFELLLCDEPQPIPVRGRVVELISYRGVTAMRICFKEISTRSRGRIAMWMARGRGQRLARRAG